MVKFNVYYAEHMLEFLWDTGHHMKMDNQISVYKVPSEFLLHSFILHTKHNFIPHLLPFPPPLPQVPPPIHSSFISTQMG